VCIAVAGELDIYTGEKLLEVRKILKPREFYG